MRLIRQVVRGLHSRIRKKIDHDRNLKNFTDRLNSKPLKIIIGSAGMTVPGWISSDINILNLLLPDWWRKLFKNKLADAFLAEHVWEHLTLEDGIVGANTCYAFLKNGGYIRVAVPDGFHPDEKYIEYVKLGGCGSGSEDHKILYTYKIIKDVFEKAGFKVNLLEYFDEFGVFHFTEWDKADGLITRSKRFDERNVNGNLAYTSIIIDAYK